MSFAGQIEYNNIKVLFVRQWNNFAISRRQFRDVIVSGSGIKEYLNAFNQEFIQAVKERLTAQELAELLQFYEYAKDGSSFIFTRDRGLGAYWNFEKTLNNNDENALTFTRTAGTAGNASYVDPSTGLLTFEDTLNIPRYGSGKYGHGLIIEGARTNICEQSIDFEAAGWAATNITRDNATTEVLDIEGGNNANKLTATAGNGFIQYSTATPGGAVTQTQSIYVRCPSGTVAGALIISDTSDGVQAAQTFTATPEWQRIQITDTNNGGIGNIALRIRIDTNTDILYTSHAQIEVGTNVKFASNFIKSVGASLVRNTEKAIVPAVNIVNNLKGSVGFWFKPEWIYNKNASAIFYWVHNSGDAARHSSIAALSNGTIEYRVYNGAGVATEVTFSSVGITQGNYHLLYCTYDTTIDNGLKIYIDGALVGTSVNDAFVPEEIGTSLAIGSSTAGANPAYCVFDEILIRKDVLPASMIAQIFQQGVGLGEIRNRWPAVALSNPDFLEEQLKGINRYNFALNMEEVLS